MGCSRWATSEVSNVTCGETTKPIPGCRGHALPVIRSPLVSPCVSAGGNVPDGPCSVPSGCSPFYVETRVSDSAVRNPAFSLTTIDCCSTSAHNVPGPFFTSCYGETLLLEAGFDGELQRSAPLGPASVCPTLHLDDEFHMVALHLRQLHNHARILPRGAGDAVQQTLRSRQLPERGHACHLQRVTRGGDSRISRITWRRFSWDTGDFLVSLIAQSGTDLSSPSSFWISRTMETDRRVDLTSVRISSVIRTVIRRAEPAGSIRRHSLLRLAYTFGNLKNNSLFGPGSIHCKHFACEAFPDYGKSERGISMGRIQCPEPRESLRAECFGAIGPGLQFIFPRSANRLREALRDWVP